MDKHKFEQEEMDLVERTAETAAEIDHHYRGGRGITIDPLKHEEAIEIVKARLEEEKKPMKEHKVNYGRVQLFKTQLSHLKQACDHALAKFNQDEFMSSQIPYKFHVTEKELRFQLNLLEYRYLSAKHTLIDLKDEVVNEGTEVIYGERKGASK